MNDPGAVERLLARVAEDGLVYPDYGGYCFAAVPGACLELLDGRPEGVPTLPDDAFAGIDPDGVRNVLVVVIDGLGYDRFRYVRNRLDAPLLSTAFERGNVTPLTAVFPSETASSIPTIHTGQYPIEHGQLGWWQYLEGVGPVQSLPYLTAAGTRVGETVPSAPDPSALCEATPLYPRVPDGVRTHTFEPREISDADQHFSQGADRSTGYSTFPELAVSLRRALDTGDGRQYLYAYVQTIDRLSHRYGPYAPETEAELESIFRTLRRQFADRLDDCIAERTLLVVTADHGQIDSGGRNIDVRGYDPLAGALARDPDGDPIPPVGGSRQLQLHLRPGSVGCLKESLQRDFDCRTFTRAEYESRQLFGPTDPGTTYDRNAPDLLWLPSGRGAWYDDDSLEMVGLHGGLSRDEMLVPFVALRLDDI